MTTTPTNNMEATDQQLDTLRNLSAVAEREGFTEAAKGGFICYSKAMTGQAYREEVNARSHDIRQILSTYKGSVFADSIASLI